MTAKKYLGQAYRLDQRINSKIEQVTSLNELAVKCTSTLSDMPKSQRTTTSSMADVIDKMIDLQNEINCDIDNLVDIKKNIMDIIKGVKNTEYQTLLELRYLCFHTWERIAVEMDYGIDNIYKLHKKALNNVLFLKTLQ